MNLSTESTLPNDYTTEESSESESELPRKSLDPQMRLANKKSTKSLMTQGRINKQQVTLQLKPQGGIEEKMDLEEPKNPQETQSISIGGYTMTIKELVYNIVENNHSVGIQVNGEKIEQVEREKDVKIEGNPSE